MTRSAPTKPKCERYLSLLLVIGSIRLFRLLFTTPWLAVTFDIVDQNIVGPPRPVGTTSTSSLINSSCPRMTQTQYLGRRGSRPYRA